MDIRLLEYFIAMAETGQITVASQKLHIAQPPLSRYLQRLEDELGVILFNRTNKGIELTNSGTVLYEMAKEFLGNYKEMLDVVKETEKGYCGVIRIGTIYSTIPLFADKISYIRQRYPLIEFQIIQDSHAELMEKMKNGLLDVMFFSMPSIEHNGFSFMLLDAEPLVLIVNKDTDPAPEKDFVTIDQLKDVPLCMMQTGDFYGYNEILIAECRKHGFVPNIICQCNTTSAAITLVGKGVGLSYQPKSVVDTTKNPYIYSKLIRDFDIKIHPAILWNKNAHLSGRVKTFLSLFDYSSIVPGPEFEDNAELAGSKTEDHL